MCGIAGEFSFNGPADPIALKGMTDAILHRGPDDEGSYCEGPVAIGHRRLSIIDLSESGRNPIWTADRSMAIVFNGEVYNYREIRNQLVQKGCRFLTGTDTEVVLNAIHHWGIEAALPKFIGMFAFAVWNAKESCLFLVRDRAGIKPLFYGVSSGSLLFGSEMRALYAHPRYRKRIDKRGLGQFFVLGYTLGDTTVFSDTYRLPAGHFLRADVDGRISVTSYWNLDNIRRGSFAGSFEEAAEELESLAESAFSYRLVSDVPVGVFLSGGIDSTFLSAILKKKLGADLTHITIGFRDARYDEAPAAAQIAKELSIRHEIHYLDAPDAVGALKQFTEIYDEPFGDSSGMPMALVSKIARERFKVALSADGGDEQFCGYESYDSYARRGRQLARIPASLRGAAARLASTLPYEPVLSRYLKRQGAARGNPRLISTVEKAFELMRARKQTDIVRIMNEKGWTESGVNTLIGANGVRVFKDADFSSRLIGGSMEDRDGMMDAMMACDYRVFMRDDVLTKVDRASMSISLECRDPFLDHRIAEFSASLPLNYLYANGEHKRILKHILRRWISEPLLKAKKRGFVIPLYEWMKGPWKPLVEEYLSPERIRAGGILDDSVVSAEVKRFYKYEGIGAEKLQLLLNFQMWAERWCQ